MNTFVLKIALTIVLIWNLMTPLVYAEEPFSIGISNYGLGQYQAGLQNWGMDVDSLNVYIANNSGMLRFNGSDWQLLQTPEKNAIRDVLVVEDRIYVAGDSELGFWQLTNNGRYIYTSLWKQVIKLGIVNDTFWSIALLNDDIYFHSYSNIVRYDGTNLHPVVLNDCYVFMFGTEKGVLGQHVNGEIIQLDSKKAITTTWASGCQSIPMIRFLYTLPSGEFLVVFSNGKIVTVFNDKVRELFQIKNSHGEPVKVEGVDYCNGIIAIGTLGNGVMLYDLRKQQTLLFDSKQLQDSNIHNIRFDGDDKIWCTTDVGVVSIDLHPVAFQQWKAEEFGVFFDGITHNEKLYFATNRGLFTEKGGIRLISSDWFPLSLTDIKDELVVGTTTNLYRYNPVDSKFEIMSSFNGVRQFEYVAHQGNEYQLMRGYSGIGILKYINGRWEYQNAIQGTEDYDFILPESPFRVWALSAGRGLVLLRISSNLKNVESCTKFDKIGRDTIFANIHPFKIESHIYFATPHNIYYFNPQTHEFVIDEVLTKALIPEGEFLATVQNFIDGRLWTVVDDILRIYDIEKEQPKLQRKFPLGDNPLAIYDRHFAVSLINDSTLLAATNQGIQRFNLNSSALPCGTLRLESISYVVKEETFWIVPERNIVSLPNSATDIQFRFAGSVADVSRCYSFRLDDLQNGWSDWQKSGCIIFSSIPSGSRNLIVRDTNDNKVLLTIQVIPPIYKRWWVISLYIIVFICLVLVGFWRIEQRKKQKIRQALEAENDRLQSELKEKENQSLREKVRTQETEMMTNLKFLTQKQELIDTISTEIEKQKKELGERWPNKNYLRLVRIIQDGATETDKLLSFEHFFVEIHKDFMDRIQSAHPDLSSGELRLACFIRANLTNKEIAAVMAIGIRSVEIKRYRLKKRLNLLNEDSLTTYVNSI